MVGALCSAEPRTKICSGATETGNIVLFGLDGFVHCFVRARWFVAIFCSVFCLGSMVSNIFVRKFVRGIVFVFLKLEGWIVIPTVFCSVFCSLPLVTLVICSVFCSGGLRSALFCSALGT